MVVIEITIFYGVYNGYGSQLCMNPCFFIFENRLRHLVSVLKGRICQQINCHNLLELILKFSKFRIQKSNIKCICSVIPHFIFPKLRILTHFCDIFNILLKKLLFKNLRVKLFKFYHQQNDRYTFIYRFLIDLFISAKSTNQG